MIFLRYVAIQLLAYGIDMGTFLLMLHVDLAGPIVANIIAKLAAGIFAFFAHRHFTFEAAAPELVKTQAIRYFILLAVNVPVSSGILAAIMLWLPVPAIAKFLADILCVGLSYGLSKYFIFNARIVSSTER
jgi:putative flippase GtrA